MKKLFSLLLILAMLLSLAACGKDEKKETNKGIPAKVVICDGKRIEQDLDQVHIPDPVAVQIKALETKLAYTETALDELEAENEELRKEIDELKMMIAK